MSADVGGGLWFRKGSSADVSEQVCVLATWTAEGPAPGCEWTATPCRVKRHGALRLRGGLERVAKKRRGMIAEGVLGKYQAQRRLRTASAELPCARPPVVALARMSLFYPPRSRLIPRLTLSYTSFLFWGSRII